jgi:fructose-bisphosphate aldolase class II
MPLVTTRYLVHEAARQGTGIGALNVLHLETAEALVRAAERAGQPVILQISQNCVAFHGGHLEPLTHAAAALAESASVGVSLHLDHAEDEALALAAVDLGYSSVMYDGATLPWDENIAATRRVVAHARTRDVFVEAELGEIGGKDGAHAKDFVASTGVDALAVAVGSSHAMTTRSAVLDLELIARLRDAVPVPLVLHGSSGVDDATMQAAIRAGIVKVNVSTHLNSAFTAAVREYLGANPAVVDSRKYMGPGREAMITEAARLLRLFALDLDDADAAAARTA